MSHILAVLAAEAPLILEVALDAKYKNKLIGSKVTLGFGAEFPFPLIQHASWRLTLK